MIKKFNEEEYLDNCRKKIKKGIDHFNSIKTYGEKYSKIVDQIWEWYGEDNLSIWILFNLSIGQLDFFENISSFLINVLLDDSYYKVVWKNNDESIGVPWKCDPSFIWAYDGDPEATSSAELMLKIFDYMNEKDKQRIKDYEQIQEMLKRLKIK